MVVRRPVHIYLAVLCAANLLLLLPQAHALRVGAALLLVGLLPGLSWSWRFFAANGSWLLRLIIASALSYTITSLCLLVLYYVPGPIYAWQILLGLNVMALLPITLPLPPSPDQPASHQINNQRVSINVWLPLLLILAMGLFLRGANLNYSEFQGDESLAMITAAEALEGHADALFLRSKGPGEVLLPMALWRLSGTINEAIARLPFTIGALLAIVTMYLLGQHLGNRQTAWLVAGFFAFHGFTVAFGRIVQYQALVLWFSALAFLLLLQWQEKQQHRFAILSGLCLGSGLLAHYDAILVLPALLWLLLQPLLSFHSSISRSRHLAAIPLLIGGMLLVALPFYLPFSLNPQANRTGSYLGQRIGSALRNNLPDFFHFNIFYSSTYFVILTAVLITGLFLWLLWQANSIVKIVGGLSILGMIGLALLPNLSEPGQAIAFIPFASTFSIAFLVLFMPRVQAKLFENPSIKQNSGDVETLTVGPLLQAGRWQAVIIWLAVPFLGYNFVVALGLTHIYTIVPAWSILAGLAMHSFLSYEWAAGKPYHRPVTIAALLLFFSLSTIFLWNAFVRHDVEYLQDYASSNSNMWFFWTPYHEPPQAGFFGFAHRAGWKAIGQKIVDKTLTGDYGSNEEPEVTTWYTRGAPRACDAQPEFYFLADDLVDAVQVPDDVLKTAYQEIGLVRQANQKRLRIQQLQPASLNLGELDQAGLSRAFEQSSIPAAFARSGRGARTAEANFSNIIKLIGYDVDTRRAYPGGRVPVTLYWQALAPIEASWQVFTHLESDTGLAAQADGVPVCWTFPTDTWRPGQIVADQHAIPISADIIPGAYRLEIGLYLADTFERLELLDQAGNPAGTSIMLESVEVRAGASSP